LGKNRYFDELISPKEVSSATGKKYRWIMKVMPDLIDAGMAVQIGGAYICHKSVIDYIKNRPETRGRKQKEDPGI